MKTKFIVITTCYNVDPYVQMNVYMNKFQSYDNVLYVYVDDNSSDDTYNNVKQLIADDDRFLLIQNPNNGSQGKSFMYAIDFLQKNNLIHDQDVIVEVDGDDWLSSVFVLDYLNEIYQYPHIWMTYGQYQIYPTGNVGGHYSMNIQDNVNLQNTHRYNPFPYSHLKTYKYWLFNKINKNDLIDPLTNEFFSAAWDHALCISMVEMAGKEHIHRCDDILYILNRADELQNEGKLRQTLQKDVEQRCRNLKPYNKIHKDYITCNLLGPGAPGGIHNYGLGNLLFQIATISTLALDNDSIAIFPQLDDQQTYNNYSSTILNKVYIKNKNINFQKSIDVPYGYHELEYHTNCMYKGYFQSESYFIHRRNYIINLFKNNDIINKIKTKYPNISDNTVSMHVRRGDYVNLQSLHPLQPIEYYDFAIEKIGSYKTIMVFSDDIQWCKQNLKYENLIFIENNSDVFDLLAMSLCTNNIIANSTFSWWGAWLNENPEKIVIAPKLWFGPDKSLDDTDIIPKTWIQI